MKKSRKEGKKRRENISVCTVACVCACVCACSRGVFVSVSVCACVFKDVCEKREDQKRDDTEINYQMRFG